MGNIATLQRAFIDEQDKKKSLNSFFMEACIRRTKQTNKETRVVIAESQVPFIFRLISYKSFSFSFNLISRHFKSFPLPFSYFFLIHSYILNNNSKF